MTEPSPANPFWAQLTGYVEQFGVNHAKTKSRRHGHQPRAKEHVEDYFANRVLGESVRAIARSRDQAPSTVAESIRRGERLVKAGAAETRDVA